LCAEVVTGLGIVVVPRHLVYVVAARVSVTLAFRAAASGVFPLGLCRKAVVFAGLGI
jgi:hypothetical protein